ncbi:MAG: acyl-ACP--UDP-N-acetylglucosamine O-acyltransferase [Deltaproteobacteria bacterium]|nr:acyl-ACP--UDP-N-acetylglucosamine O-acyltransferase [Deltaproteobacteria bacterium]
MIHSTAIISPDARLGEGVEVGPYAVVGPEVSIGDGSRIDSHAVVESHVRMGKNCRVSSFASVGAPPQDLKFRGEETWVEIGDDVVVREYATINRGTATGLGTTRVGNNCMIMAYCHVAHDCQVGNRVIMANAATLAGHIEIEDGAFIGGLTGVHQFVKIGTLAMIGAQSGVSQDVPPYVKAVALRQGRNRSLFGLNVVGLRRAGLTPETIATLKKAYRILFNSEMPMREALDRAESEVEQTPEVKHLIGFVRSSKRGVLR